MAFLFSNSNKPQTEAAGPQFGALRMQSSAFGLPLGVVFGVTRVSGNMVDWVNFAAHAHTSQANQGGKGGPSIPSQTTWTYSVSWLLAFGEGPWHSIRRCWRGKNLSPVSGYHIFLGTWPQDPWDYLLDWDAAHPNDPPRAFPYPGIAMIGDIDSDLGTSDTLEAISVEAVALLPWTGSFETVQDASIVLPQENFAQEEFTIDEFLAVSISHLGNFARDAGVIFTEDGTPLTRVDGNPTSLPVVEAYTIAAPGTHAVDHAALFANNVDVYYHGVGDIYDEQENYTVTSPGTHTVANAGAYRGNIGVFYQVTGPSIPIEESYTIDAGSHAVAHAADFNANLGVRYKNTGQYLTRVTGAPAYWQYSVNEATGVYTFYTGPFGDFGREVIIKYNYNDNVPGAELTPVTSGTPNTGQYLFAKGTYTFNFAGSDLGKTVIIKYKYADTHPGTPLARVYSVEAPDPGEYMVDEETGIYTFSLDEVGIAVDIHYNFSNAMQQGAYMVDLLGTYTFHEDDIGKGILISYFFGEYLLEVHVGADGAHLNPADVPPGEPGYTWPPTLIGWRVDPTPEPNEPGWDGFKEDLGVRYQNGGSLERVATVEEVAKGKYWVDMATGVYSLSSSDGGSTLYFNYSYWRFIGSIPSDIVTAILTAPHFGMGFPAANLGDLTDWGNCCLALGLLLSPAYLEPKTGEEILTQMMKVTNSEIFESAGLLKIVPYADEEITGNGVCWTPDLTPKYDLTDNDFLGEVKVVRKSNADAYNIVPVEFKNRKKNYDFDIPSPPARDLADIQDNGPREMDTVIAHELTDEAPAQWLGQILLQHSLHVLSQYEFTVGWRYVLLEPMDLVTLTTTRAGLALNRKAVRIISIEEDDTGALAIVAEDARIGVAAAPAYPPFTPGNTGENYNVFPGNINPPVVFMPPTNMMSSPFEIWMGISGISDKWGGCEIWASHDDETYAFVDLIRNPCRQGILTAPIPAVETADQVRNIFPGQVAEIDLANTLAVDLTMSRGSLVSGTEADRDNLRNLVYFAGDRRNYTGTKNDGLSLMSFQTATLTAPYRYDLTNLLRLCFKARVSAGSIVCGFDAPEVTGFPEETTFPSGYTKTFLYSDDIYSYANNYFKGWEVVFYKGSVAGPSFKVLKSYHGTNIPMQHVPGAIVIGAPILKNTYDNFVLYPRYDHLVSYGGLTGTPFLYLDKNVYKYRLPLDAQGKTIYLKFLSFNIYGLMKQTLDQARYYAMTLGSLDNGQVSLVKESNITIIGTF
ncbi:MAG: phage tail protein [Candidatus Cryosericum sp.]